MTTQSDIFSDFNLSIPPDIREVLLPHIVGPQALLHRYSNVTEKLAINLGAYISTSNNTYTWPGRNVNSIIDLAYPALYIDNALLRTYLHTEGVNGVVTAVGGYFNRIITTATDGFKTNTITYPRDPQLGDRDVTIGDTVRVSHTITELYTTVAGVIATNTAASIAAATSDAANLATQGASSSTTQTAGTVNDVTLTETLTAYNGYASGYINETYTVTVIQASTGGNATTAKINIASTSGTDDQTNITPSAFAAPTNIGTRGLTATFANVVNNLLVSQTWVIQVHEVFTKPIPTSAGTYTGNESPTYIIRVSLGGRYADATKPQISVTSNLGTDSSGPTTVTAAATPYAVGTEGVTIAFSGNGLRLGDIYYITVTGPTPAAYKTLLLNDNLPATLIAAGDMRLEIFLERNLVVNPQNVNSPPNLNWTADQTGITVNQGMTATDAVLTNSGSPMYVAVLSGPNTLMYSQYREWDQTNVNKVLTLQTTDITQIPTLVAAIVGTVNPDNPIAYGLSKALLNANGQPVNFTCVSDPTDLVSWSTVLSILEGLPINTISALSNDYDIHDLVIAHVVAQSVDNLGCWRCAWLPLVATASTALVDQATSSNTQVVLAQLIDNPSVTGTQYTYLTVTSGNAQFVTNGVVAGDIVRYLYSVDGFGNETYTSFVVSSVVNESTLILVSGNNIAVNVSQRVEVWRNSSASQQAAAMVARCQAVANARIRYVFPDTIQTTEGTVEGYFLCSALAGFTSGIAPQQGLKGIPIAGFTGVTSSFSNGQLNTLATGGAFVVTQVGNDIVTRSPLTTDQSSVANGYEVINRDDDSIRHVIYNSIAQFFDTIHLTDAGLVMIYSSVSQTLFELQSRTYIQRVGAGMIVDGNVVSVRVGVLPDTVVVQLNVTRAYPVETLLLQLTFS